MKNFNRVGNFYDQFSGSYTDYANGTSVVEDLLDVKCDEFNGAFSWGDIQTWKLIRNAVDVLVRGWVEGGGGSSVRILDVGCGDGVWALRIANYCVKHSVPVELMLLDLSPEVLRRAADNFNCYLNCRDGVDVKVEYGLCDLACGLPSGLKSGKFDIVLCLHTVLNHLSKEDISFSIDELIRVTDGSLCFSVKPPFSSPTFYAAPMSEIIHFSRHNEELYALDRSGGFHVVRSSLISYKRLRSLLDNYEVKCLFLGLDVFISRMRPDPRWVANDIVNYSLPLDDLLSLEARVMNDSRYLDFANHILVVVDVI